MDALWPRLQDEHVGRAPEGGVYGDGLRERRVEQPASAKVDRRPGEPRQPS